MPLNFIKKTAQKLICLIFPKKCLICNKIIYNDGFCAKDWNKLQFLQEPACDICYQPFEFKIEGQIHCASCLQKKPSYFKALSVLEYDDYSKEIIGKFKYLDQSDIGKFLARLMFNKAQEILPNIDFIAPIPLHKLRLMRRKYNQSAILTKEIGRLADKKILIDLLLRRKNNQPQAGLSKKMRIRNVAGIFDMQKKYRQEIKDKNILLIDDVITTGATIEACCQKLRKYGVGKIYVLTLAKSVIR